MGRGQLVHEPQDMDERREKEKEHHHPGASYQDHPGEIAGNTIGAARGKFSRPHLGRVLRNWRRHTSWGRTRGKTRGEQQSDGGTFPELMIRRRAQGKRRGLGGGLSTGGGSGV